MQVSDEERNRFFYETCGDRYDLWFGTTLGRSMTYDSATRKWNSLNVVCDGRKQP